MAGLMDILGFMPQQGGGLMAPASDPVVNRGLMWPVGRTESGQKVLAWPQAALEAYDAFTLPSRTLQGYQPSMEDVMNMALTVGAGGLAGSAPRQAARGLMGEAMPAELGIFGGSSARTADLFALDRAQEMAKEGVHPNRILDETGWFKGADDKWRFEIDDSAARFSDYGDIMVNSAQRGHPRKTTLGEALEHPELFAAYPEAQNIPLTLQDDLGSYRGMYAPDQNEIGIAASRVPEDMLSTLLHETQHAVQQREDFARGSNPEWAVSDAARATANAMKPENIRASREYDSLREQAAPIWKAQWLDRLDGLMMRDSLKPREVFRLGDWYTTGRDYQRIAGPMPKKPGTARDEWLRGAVAHMRRAYIEELGATEAANVRRLMEEELPTPRDRKNAAARIERKMDKVREGARKHMEAKDRYNEALKLEPYEAYRRSAGETEARNVQARQKMTKEERAAKSPFMTQDYPFERQYPVGY